MTLLQPFRAWRPRSGLEEQVAAPPYDVINSQEARAMAQGNPVSFLHVSKAEIDLEPGMNPYDDRVYATARKRFLAMRTEGLLIQDSNPGYYIYRLEMQGREQIGVAGLASVDDYRNERIKKHEFTRPDKENDRTRLADTLDAHTGPVFLTYRHDPTLETAIRHVMESHPPACDFVAEDHVRHTLWVAQDPTVIGHLTNGFDRLPALYIADGHHRAAAAARVCQARRAPHVTPDPHASYDRFLVVAFPDSQVRILDYNRLIRDLNGYSVEAFLEQVKTKFHCTKATLPVRPTQTHEFGMYLKNQWYYLEAMLKPDQEHNPVARLDVTLLQDNLLDPILGIVDPRKDTRIDFVGGIRGLEELMRRVDSGEMAVAFSMFPTSLSELMAVADSGQVMPPKSTWFEPKLRDGLILQAW
ncbi:MAG: DUF1015 family protein [Magnetococcus sp. YQC-5]